MQKVKKKYKYLYSRMLDEEVIRKAYRNLRKKKADRPEIQEIDRNLDYYVQKMKAMLENTKPEGVPVEHPELAFRPEEHEPVTIMERGKRRKIYKPSITEQWVHHIIMVVLAPILMKRFYCHSNGSIPKRGAHRGKKTLIKWIRKGFRYFFKCDVCHYYDSIEADKLIEHLKSFIEDDWFIHIIRVCLMHHKKGIPIGYYISQWFGNSYLISLDEMIAGKHKMYMRYVDDIVVCGDNKRELRRLVEKIKQHLGKLHLRLKGNWQICRFDYIKKDGKRTGRAIDFMGFKFYRSKTTLRKNILKNTGRTVGKISMAKEAGKKIFHKHASAMLSYMGWITHTDTYGWYISHVKPYVEIKSLKRLLSRLSKKRRKHEREKEPVSRA